jgi:type I restriction enzyme R subunit
VARSREILTHRIDDDNGFLDFVIRITGSNSDSPRLKKWHLEPTREKQIRKSFIKVGEWPKILIVTEKLLTGFDAPILYAMYLDKPMRDHTLLQAIARVNRPYENEAQEMVKPRLRARFCWYL